MTTMTIVDVLNQLYPNQLKAGNITLGYVDGSSISITYWNVAGQSQPSIAALEAQIPTLQHQFDLDCFKSVGQSLLEEYIDSVALQKLYSSAVSCASYTSSTNLTWQNEAITFVAWRDAVYTYVITQTALMESDARTIPTFSEFQTELPVISWPS